VILSDEIAIYILRADKSDKDVPDCGRKGERRDEEGVVGLRELFVLYHLVGLCLII